MKKLPLCALTTGALFAIAGTLFLLQLAPRPEPLPLFFPLAWDLIMVTLGLGVVLRCECARRAAMIWSVFCIVASLAIGAAALGWLLPQESEPLSGHRLVFMLLAVGFGVLFGIWQLFALRSPELLAWTSPLTPTANSGDTPRPT